MPPAAMSARVEILTLADRERWLAEDARDGRPSQAWHYAQAIARPDLAPCLALVTDGSSRLRVPYYEREWRGARDIATWLGLSGASASDAAPAPWQAWRAHAVARGWVAGYLQLADDALPAVHADDTLASGNEVFFLDLDDGDPLARASEIVRRKARRAARDGVVAGEDPAALADALVALYPGTMQRLGAHGAYRHGEAALRAIAAIPGALLAGAVLAGRIEAVAVFLVAGARAEYLCNACTERGRDFAAWQIAWAAGRLRERGVRELNLGGGVRPGDGLHQFKTRFHGRARPLRALHQVYDPARYRALCVEAGRVEADGWFPAYRRAPAAPG
jgi:hypothetical protein